jgi:hypothetical protein
LAPVRSGAARSPTERKIVESKPAFGENLRKRNRFLVFFCFLESGLFNRLGPIQIDFFPPRFPADRSPLARV